MIAVLPIEPMLKQLLIRIQVVKHHIRIAAVTRRKQDQLKLFVQVLQESQCIGSDVNTSLKEVTSL